MKQIVGKEPSLSFLPVLKKELARAVLNLKCKDVHSYLLHIYYLCSLLLEYLNKSTI